MVDERISDVQSSYDKVADEYARHIYDELQHKPLDRKLLDRFAESVGTTGIVCDLGCGPGHIARYLHERGIQVCGMDLSHGMIAQARQLNPGIEFRQGDMRALEVRNNTWAGIAAFYAIVNLPAADVAKALQEMHRVLAPDGRLLLSFHAGDDTSQIEQELWGHEIALEITFFRLSPSPTAFERWDLRSKKSSSAGPTHPTSSTRADALTFLRKNQ